MISVSLLPFDAELTHQNLDESCLVFALLITFNHFGGAGKQRMKPVLDHVLGAFPIQQVHHPSPLVPIIQRRLQNYQVLLNLPLPVLHHLVQMVQPALTALLRSLEVFSLALEENVPRNISPSPNHPIPE
jgi:hypothetical protein